MQPTIYFTDTHDPWYNLAVEEYLLNHLAADEVIFYLWQNQNTVVIGKNQNPWRECQIKLLDQDSGKLARRISGGGAVFHDLGNLNFSFIVPKAVYDLQRQLKVILTAVQSLGIAAEFQGRNDLQVVGRKFSGNAFCWKTQSVLHHGTLLVEADLEKLTKYLQVSSDKIRSKGVDSIRSRVINLSDCVPLLNIHHVAEALLQSFAQEYGPPHKQYSETGHLDAAEIRALYDRNASWGWRYGHAPEFDILLETRFNWGDLQLYFKLTNGNITHAQVYSDALDEAFISQLPCIFQGCKLNAQDLSERLQASTWNQSQKEFALEIANWLQSKL